MTPTSCLSFRSCHIMSSVLVLIHVVLGIMIMPSMGFNSQLRPRWLKTSRLSGAGSLRAVNLNAVATEALSLFQNTILLADTSISEEEVLAYTGTTSNLPNPLWAVAFAAVIFGGVAILQFSLGDLTTEEGQARVRDYLNTKNDTERKRGYFD